VTVRAVFYHPGGRWSGEARAFTAAARGLAARGWTTALATGAGSPAEALARADGVQVAAVDDASTYVGAVAELARVLRAARAGAVFVHGARAQHVAAGAAWRAGGVCVVRRAPVGATLAGLGAAASRAALRAAPTAFLCAWPEQAEQVPARAQGRAVVADLGVPPGPDDSGDGAAYDAPPGPSALRRQRLVCVFEPAAQLRAATVLRAVARLAPRHPDLEVLLAGPGAGDEGLQMHAAALGIHHRVRTLDPARPAARGRPAGGPLAGAAVAWVVADGDDGAFGALDAMTAGVPVLADRGSAAARYVADGITGLHLAPGDVTGTAAALAQLLAADETRRHMGAAGRARAARSYTEAAMLDGFARAAAAAAPAPAGVARARAGTPA
jgi:hypothetical protein